jgi:calcineurin-like phosphoesterase family protein
MTRQWFSADLHFGHTNIIEYCQRPFRDVAEMNNGLVERWNSVVAPEDTVWVLGDVAMGKIDDSLAMVRRLHGRKHLVTGNHDRCWPAHGDKATGWEERYRDEGFDEIHHGVRSLRVVASDGRSRDVVMCHFPYEGDSQDIDRYPGARPDDHGDWLLHGHVHDVWRQNARMINVGIDGWGGVPVSADEIVDLIDAGQHELAPRPWVAPGRAPVTSE